ncbi:MAG: hypothetical protein OEU74_06110 [Gammaproteobacteria bacterium]|nr:hypothetical protein [Gammaproteobacteria bacterium]
MKQSKYVAAFMIWASAALLPVGTLASEQESWEFGASIYGWFPDISGHTSFSPPGGGGDFEIGIDQILDNLEFTLMGTFDARKGRGGLLVDMIYMGVGNSKSGVREGTIGGTPIPVGASAAVDLDLDSWIWTVAGYYRTVDQPEVKFDLLAGLRYTDVEQKVNWNITGNVASIPVLDRTGTAEAGLENWDVIVGARGNYSFGANNTWFVPYYLDVGTGDSDQTWQAIAGLGYKFHWGEAVAAWRYLSYDLPSDSAIADMNFNGPAIGVTFRW